MVEGTLSSCLGARTRVFDPNRTYHLAIPRRPARDRASLDREDGVHALRKLAVNSPVGIRLALPIIPCDIAIWLQSSHPTELGKHRCNATTCAEKSPESTHCLPIQTEVIGISTKGPTTFDSTRSVDLSIYLLFIYIDHTSGYYWGVAAIFSVYYS